jgi:catechol 2,3-dioxygenase-like lactoylglutathione lyase family enzyme
MRPEEQESRTDSGSVAIRSISAVTLAISDMARSIQFYRALGFTLCYGGEKASFSSLIAGSSYLNLMATGAAQRRTSWGRVIFHVSDVDAMHRQAVEQGLRPETSPCDASWGERYFHISDPDGHDLSFAKPLGTEPREHP